MLVVRRRGSRSMPKNGMGELLVIWKLGRSSSHPLSTPLRVNIASDSPQARGAFDLEFEGDITRLRNSHTGRYVRQNVGVRRWTSILAGASEMEQGSKLCSTPVSRRPPSGEGRYDQTHLLPTATPLLVGTGIGTVADTSG